MYIGVTTYIEGRYDQCLQFTAELCDKNKLSIYILFELTIYKNIFYFST